MLTVSVVCVVTGQPSAMPGGETTDDGGQDQHAQHPQARAQDQGDHHQEPGQAHYQEEGAIITVGVFAGRATAGCFTASLAGYSRMFHSITGRATAGCFTASLAGYSHSKNCCLDDLGKLCLSDLFLSDFSNFLSW